MGIPIIYMKQAQFYDLLSIFQLSSQREYLNVHADTLVSRRFQHDVKSKNFFAKVSSAWSSNEWSIVGAIGQAHLSKRPIVGAMGQTYLREPPKFAERV